MKFRFHRGGLKESLATTVEVNTIDELKKYIEKQECYLEGTIEDILFEYSYFDERTRWNTYYVSYKKKGIKSTFLVGMSDGKLN